MTSSALNLGILQAKISNIQNAADSSTVYSGGVWSFKNSSAVASVTIDNSGNVGVGTTSPSYKVEVLGNGVANNAVQALAQLRSASDAVSNSVEMLFTPLISGQTRTAIGGIREGITSNAALYFATNNTERARIDASGNLLINRTNLYLGEKLSVINGGASANTAVFAFSTTDDRANTVFYHARASGVTSAQMCSFLNSAGGTVGSITSTGSATSYNPSSDKRLKENIEPIENALEAVKKLQPRKYTWKECGTPDDGFIAQELQQIPEFAHRVNPIGERDGETYYGVDYMRFVTYLTAAIQEQQVMIEAMKAEIEALKAK